MAMNNRRDESDIKDVATYIDQVKKLARKKTETNKKIEVLFRGECKIYPQFCIPNIFRKNVLSENGLYEKNLFEAMRQNNFSCNTSYLSNAIDAQHGEFPSRLLDVTYNCLIALYFAVTPYYKIDNVKKYDNESGAVYLIYIEDVFSPSAKNTNDYYDAIISGDSNWFNHCTIFNKNHKFIDHTKLNNRIIAQQGAFILFQGINPSPLPEYMYEKIVIPDKSKSTIREELLSLFGIHNGSIYPEITNYVEILDSKSKKMVNDDFSLDSELTCLLKTLKCDLDYYANQLERIDTNQKDDFNRFFERKIKSYKLGFMELYSYLNRKKGCGNTEKINDYIDIYNQIINQACESSSSFENLTIKINNMERGQ